MTDIAQLGYSVDSSQMAKATVELDKNTAAAGRTQTATQKLAQDSQRLALSQKQLLAAQRQLPMQFTDIFTTLQAGQSPMQVLLQQGGQLKDTFGGIVPALRASAGYLAGLINPVTVLAGGVAALGLAWKQNQDQLDDFNVSLARTSNRIGMTADDLQGIARDIDRGGLSTIGGASEAVNRIVAGGKIARDQLKQVAEATAEWSSVSGDSIDDIAKKYESLTRDPLKGLLKLGEAEIILTKEQADRIRKLQEEGREQEAVAQAVKMYTDHLNQASGAVRGNLGEMATLWNTVKNEVAGAWAEVQTYMGLLDRAAKANLSADLSTGVSALLRGNPGLMALRQINEAGRSKYGAGAARPAVQWAGIDAPVDQAAFAKEEEERKKAEREFGSYRERSLEKQLKLEEDIKTMREAGLKLGKQESELAKVEADMRARYKESLPKGSSASKTDPTDALIRRLREQIALNEEQAKSEDKLTTTEKMLVDIRTELDRIGSKGSATNKNLIADLMEQAKATDDAALATVRLAKEQEALARLREQSGLAEQNQRRANEIDLLGIGHGSEATEVLRRQLELNRWYEDQVVELRRQAAREKRDITLAEEQELKDSLQRQLDEERRYQEQRKIGMADWSNGANRAFEDYVNHANDVAGQTYEIFSNAFYGLENVITDFLHKGSADWKGFLDDMNHQILQFIVRQQLSKWMQSLMGAGGEGGAGGGWQGAVGRFLGALFGGGRASGGDVQDGMFYRTGENDQPELLNLGRGRQYLIPGDNGNVEPMRGGGGDTITIQQTIPVQGRVDRRAAQQIARDALVEASTALRRNGGK